MGKNLYNYTESEYERQGIVTLSDGTQRRAIVTWDERELINNTYASYYNWWFGLFNVGRFKDKQIPL